tara:strand:- start:683 stop:907 length:225 start_codon:yes stop_codon:yes gene_type:complete
MAAATAVETAVAPAAPAATRNRQGGAQAEAMATDGGEEAHSSGTLVISSSCKGPEREDLRAADAPEISRPFSES